MLQESEVIPLKCYSATVSEYHNAMIIEILFTNEPH
jgi:hypothetical protein